MADKIFFKTGSASSLPTTKTAGQLLFAIDGTTGSIYLDKDSNTRIKFNADAVKLATPRTINGTTFDGSSDITTANWGTARNISISDATGANTGAAVSVNGSQAVTLKLPATLVATLKGNADTATKATSADKATVSESCTGNAATASKLKTGVSINGSTFDGSAGITTSKWGTARIITVSDNTGDHTQANSGIDGSANFTIKLPATITATLVGNASSATYATNAGTADTAKACTGNAATASKLKTGVAINGTTFDGSAAITTTKWGTARNISIGNSDGTGAGTAVSVDGSGAVTLKLPTEIKANVTSAGKLSGDSSDVGDANTPVYFEDGIPKPITSIDVKSDKAGKLDPGASINGTLFTGESNITTANWGTARNVTIQDASKTNTGAAVSVNGSAAFSLLLPATIKATLDGNAATATKLADDLKLQALQEPASIYWNPYTWTINQAWNGANGMYILTDTQNKFHGIFAVKILNGNAKNNTTYGSVQWLSSSDLTPPTLTITTESQTDSVVYRLYITPPAGYKNYYITKIRSQGISPVTSLEKVTSMIGVIKSTASSVDVTTAAKLATPKAINGTNFDGSGPITTAKWGTPRTITIADNSSTYTQANANIDGSANFTLKLPATLAASITGNAATATKATSADSATTATTCTGNAGTATALKNARSINGTSFNGTGDITTANWGTARTVTISDNDGTNTQANTGINGSANFTLKLPPTIKANITGKATSAGTADTATTATTATTTTGNAGSATKLQTARSINGTSFDGSGDITTASWGTARNISIANSDGTGAGTAVSVNGSGAVSLLLPATIKANLTGKATSAGTADSATTATTATTCTGNAATASKLKTGVAINGTTFDGSTAITTDKWGTPRTLSISSTAGTTGTSIDGSKNESLIIPATLTGFTSITSTTFVGNLSGKATSAGKADSATTAASCTGNAATASKLATARSITLAGDVTGTTSFDGSGNVSITATVADDSHNHVISNIDNLQASLNSKADYLSSLSPAAQSEVFYLKICTIKIPTGYTDMFLEFHLSGRTGKRWEVVRVGAYKSNTTAISEAYIRVSGHYGNVYNVTGYHYVDATNGDYLEIWCSVPSWDTINVVKKTLTGNFATVKDCVTWNVAKSSAFPPTSSSTIKFDATLEEWSGAAVSLKNSRTINGTAFNGTSNITTSYWGTSRDFTIKDSSGNKGTAVSVNGNANVELILPTTIAATVSAADKLTVNAGDSNTPVYFEGGVPKPVTSIDVKSDKAAKLDPGAKINGTLFTGENDITTDKWGTERTISISSTAGTTGTKINGSENKSLIIPSTMTGFASITSTTFVGNLSGKATSAGTADSATTASSCTGNAATATKLQTIRSINGTNFDGSADITTVKWGTARDVTIGDTKKSVNGNTNYAWTHDEIGWRRSWSTTITCATWSRLCYVAAATNVIGSKFLLNIGSTRNNVVYNDLFVITTHHSSKASIVKLSGSQYSTGYQIRVLSNSNGDCYVELYDALHDATSATTTTVNCRLIPVYAGALTKYTSFTSGATLPTNFSVSKTLTISNTSDLQGNLEGKATEAGLADKASKLATARSITLAGDVTGTTSFDGSSNVSITTTVANDSHNHTYSTISLLGSYVSNTSYTDLPSGITCVEMPATATVASDPTYGAMLTVKYGGNRAFQMVGNSNNKLYFRGLHSGLSSDAGTGYGPWRMVALSDGGTYAMNITGNASGTASKLATPRNITISGTASSSVGTFDGGSNTTIYMPLTIQGFNEIQTKKLTITGTEQVSHLAFSRGGWNYFTAPASGSFAFVPNGGTTTGGAGATFVITSTTVQPGEKNNTIDLGTSSYRWKNVYATTFTGALSGNATTATTLATPRNLTISDTASSSVASFNGGSNTTLYMPLTIKGFTSIESDKFVVNDKVTLQYNTTNECLEFVFA